MRGRNWNPTFDTLYFLQIAPNGPEKPYEVDPRDRMQFHSTVDAESIAKFIQGRTGTCLHT